MVTIVFLTWNGQRLAVFTNGQVKPTFIKWTVLSQGAAPAVKAFQHYTICNSKHKQITGDLGVHRACLCVVWIR